ncbi:hypothetical protein VO178_17490 [Lysinibacillus fusiformis]|uniref:hypothetical protein n=1 Tax=Lysinibacillus fusiformis TaxID=28031 RepID=UPI002D77B93A|nr:hypothetical protein [Lysinibacillus fusiformis]WRS97150.1 hypothetical protein VO178_17490 [Lysinibacillus fusiformis]
MNILEKINNGNCAVEELIEILGEKNPIILYHVMIAIGKYEIFNEDLIKTLNDLSFKRESKDKLIGYYKIGDLAMVTLKKIGFTLEAIPTYQKLDDFEKGMIVKLYSEIDW